MNECKQKDAPRFVTINRNQVVLTPLNVEKLIPLDHPARNLWEFLGRLDLSQFSNDIKAVAKNLDTHFIAAFSKAHDSAQAERA